MQCLINTNRDIYFNLALEEYFLMQAEEDFFVLWQSEPAVVVGKHQNTLSEINYRFVRENDIRVARRLSGGGTVYHDQGNLNFTFISNGEPGRLVDFKRFIEPVTAFLDTLGLAAEQGPKNEILTRGRKISGNAEHVYKNRVLHHGTLLFNSDLRLLRESLRITPGRYKDRAVQSNRSSVINISECLADNMELAEFEKAFFSFMLNRTKGKIMTLSAKECNNIENLATSKYRTWDWIFGWSPDYQLTNNFHYQETVCRIFVNVHRGIIKDCLLDSEKISPDDLRSLISLLENCRHEPDNIRKAVKAWNHPAISEEKVVEEMVWSFF